MPEVRAERTGWRDAALSERHRHWGWDCPAVDIDFLLVEYDHGKACALVEYKHERAAIQDARKPTYQALIDLGDRAGIPVLFCRYADDFSAWTVTPLNQVAMKFVPKRVTLDEAGWVKLLYRIRDNEAPQTVIDEINTCNGDEK